MNIKQKILIIDDEVQIRRFLRASLSSGDIEILEASTGREGISMTATHNPDVVLLDLGLPDISGIEVLKNIREWSEVPLIILSARGEESDKILALDSGADDYLTKPFSVGELQARIRVVLRNKQNPLEEAPTIFEKDFLKIDFGARRVFVNNQDVHLTPTEYKLLSVLVHHCGRVLTHKQLLNEVWGAAYANQTHYLRVFMGQLRQKIERDPAQPQFFITEPGVGYRFQCEFD